MSSYFDKMLSVRRRSAVAAVQEVTWSKCFSASRRLFQFSSLPLSQGAKTVKSEQLLSPAFLEEGFTLHGNLFFIGKVYKVDWGFSVACFGQFIFPGWSRGG